MFLQVHCFMKRRFKQWCWTIPPISTKRTITSDLKSMNTNKVTTTFDVGNSDHGLEQTHNVLWFVFLNIYINILSILSRYSCYSSTVLPCGNLDISLSMFLRSCDWIISLSVLWRHLYKQMIKIVILYKYIYYMSYQAYAEK